MQTPFPAGKGRGGLALRPPPGHAAAMASANRTEGAPRLFCFGFGYSADRLAVLLAAEGWRIAGTTRSAERVEALRRRGIEAYRFESGRPLPAAREALSGTTHLLSSIPPGEAGDPVLAAHGEDILALPGLSWAGYLSTTGVYGDARGGWVDEAAPLRPTGARGERRLAAEAAWRALERRGLPLHIFRLAGIYGPGRNQLEAVRSGRARRILKPGQVFSRIHVEDIARLLRASMLHPHPGSLYNLADDLPCDPAEVLCYAAELLGLPPPPAVPLEEAELSPMARSFYEDSKRVSNRRIKQELGIDLAYPTYREGLAALAAQGEGD